MTEFQLLLRAIEVRGQTAARAGIGRAGAAVQAAALDSGVTATRDGDDIVLSAPGLRARAFGSRRAAADPRLLALGR